MKIELTDREVDRLTKILNERYNGSLNLFEIADIKGILEKMGVEVKDWTPTFEELNSWQIWKTWYDRRVKKDN